MVTLAPGDVFAGRYEILSLLGQGGMGCVYRARHVELRTVLALKVLGPSKIEDGEVRFEREARAIAKLDHPGCVRIYDYGRTMRHQFIAMQLVEGQTLAATLREGWLSIPRAMRVTRGLLSALAHAHARGVLHRDLKPDNLMLVGPGERPVLIDFGLAHLESDAHLTARGMCVGSPSYLAPERIAGQPHDTRADLYAVGVMLYEMLGGIRPFVGATPAAIIQQSQSRPARPLRGIRDDISRPLEAVVTRALAKDPARRFASAEDMLAALEDVPALEQLAVSEAAALRDEAATTMVNARLVTEQPSILSRIWGWLRFGRWRWSRRDQVYLPTDT